MEIFPVKKNNRISEVPKNYYEGFEKSRGNPYLFGDEERSRIRSIVEGYSRSMGIKDHDVEDITQDVILRLMKTRNAEEYDYKPGDAKYITWLSTIIRNKVIDRSKRVGRRRETSLEDLEENHPNFILDEEDNEKDGFNPKSLIGIDLSSLPDLKTAQEALNFKWNSIEGVEKNFANFMDSDLLSPEFRAVANLRMRDLKYKKIAEILNIPEGTVKSRLSRFFVNFRGNFYRKNETGPVVPAQRTLH